MQKIKFAVVSIFLLFVSNAMAGDQNICPIMVDSDIDTEEVVEFEGNTIYMCCGGCVKAWNKNPLYYLRVGRDLDLLPQFKDVSADLKKRLDNVELLEQRFCVIRHETVISPESPSIEYNGKKIYFYKKRDIERKWEKDPEGIFEEALAKGILPQFKK